MTDAIDDLTPVLIGVGQASERLDEPGYRALSPVELATAAARAALTDTGAPDRTALVADIDVVAVVRQFEVSSPIGWAPLGRASNVPRAIAGRLGADPARAVLEIAGGQAPQRLATEFARSIAAGASRTVLLAGAEAISTARHFTGRDDRPDFTEEVPGSLEDRGYGIAGVVTKYMLDHGLIEPPTVYAVLENARRARLGLDRATYARRMAELFAPFTAVAAANPHAASPVVRSADELVAVTEQNRLVSDPYPRLLVARDQVNQGAAALLTSVGRARALGIPQDRWLFLAGHADLDQPTVLERADLGSAPAAVAAVLHALDLAGISLDEIAALDLYSCFPIAVSAVLDGLGLAPDDPRGLTLTGGLPYFGGAGNNYSMHALAELAARLRAEPGTYGLLGANGGMINKYSAGVWTTRPTPWREDRSAELQAELDAAPRPALVLRADGPATVESFTTSVGRDGTRRGIVVGRLVASDARFLATVDAGDPLMDLLAEGEPLGAPCVVRSSGRGNRVTAAPVAAPRPSAADPWDRDWQFLQVSRDGHLLQVVIDRPDVRNALHPPANDELAAVWDAYLTDPELWVAVIAGAGGSFCAGNDLTWTATGKPMWFPTSGFAGLTSRRGIDKPIIAAVEGFALGGGLELALACHMIVADPTARFALTETRVGLIAAMGGLARLPRAVPAHLANEMVLTGRRLDADEALAAGLVNRIADEGGALAAARELAGQVLQSSPTSVRLSLQVMADAAATADPVEAAAAVTECPVGPLDRLLVSEDTREGLLAFAEKRAPRWVNR